MLCYCVLSIKLWYFAVANDGDTSALSSDSTKETSYAEADKLVDGMDFGELCNEFECISSPLVESTARQLARDILELREGNRALGTFAVSVKYKVLAMFYLFINKTASFVSYIEFSLLHFYALFVILLLLCSGSYQEFCWSWQVQKTTMGNHCTRKPFCGEFNFYSSGPRPATNPQIRDSVFWPMLCVGSS